MVLVRAGLRSRTRLQLSAQREVATTAPASSVCAAASSARVINALLLTLFALVSAACTPQYNWREVRDPDAGYQAMMPAKPTVASRQIDLDGSKVMMKMAAAQVDDSVFSVGIVTLAGDDDALREKALAAMRAQMLRNLSADPTRSIGVEVPLIDAAGAPLSRVPVVQLEARRRDGAGKGRDGPDTMIGGFGARGARAYQFLVIGNRIDADAARYFIESFRMIQ